ncbi:MAG: MarR family transcriptional regulator [Ruthenibacterium sp.]
MTAQEAQLNTFLVDVFNDILRLEDASVRKSCKNLSVSELHVLSAAAACAANGNAGMAEIAAQLGVTASTLTASVKTLEHKGYLLRTRDGKDKRRVSVTLTDLAQPVLACHNAFHEKMVAQVTQHLDDAQLAAFGTALTILHTHFKTM